MLIVHANAEILCRDTFVMRQECSMHYTATYLKLLDWINIVCDSTIYNGFNTAWDLRLFDLPIAHQFFSSCLVERYTIKVWVSKPSISIDGTLILLTSLIYYRFMIDDAPAEYGLDLVFIIFTWWWILCIFYTTEVQKLLGRNSYSRINFTFIIGLGAHWRDCLTP